MSSTKLPQTDSIQALAQFWDTHDLTDFEDELEEVTDSVFERETIVNLHLPAAEAATAQRIAQAKGVALGDLLREWVVEKAHSY